MHGYSMRKLCVVLKSQIFGEIYDSKLHQESTKHQVAGNGQIDATPGV